MTPGTQLGHYTILSAIRAPAGARSGVYRMKSDD